MGHRPLAIYLLLAVHGTGSCKQCVCLVLGDPIHKGRFLPQLLRKTRAHAEGIVKELASRELKDARLD